MILQKKKKQADDQNIFFQKRHTDGQQANEEMLNTVTQERNANQNHNEILPHIGQNGYHQKVYE